MGQTFVYNAGEPKIEKKHLEVTFGVFIDGTLNSKANTKLRYKVEGIADPLLEKGEATTATAAEKKIFEENTDTKSWWRRLADIGGYGDDTSYHNDYTNVARKWFCTQKAYHIYVEGMGTEDFKNDVSDGYAFGSGLTGIRAKVRKGCEDLATKIVNEIKDKKNSKKILTQVTVDVFGFSRGAAAARNMAYEIRKKAYAPKEGLIPDGYGPIDSNSGTRSPKFRQAQVDQDGLEIDPSMLVDGKIPKNGYLGYCLLKKISAEELEQIAVRINFLGVYDTVSSYYEGGDSLGTYNQEGEVVDEGLAWKAAKKTVRGMNPIGDSNPFSNNEEELNLHDLGTIQKAVHFTAADEHRVNFSLTRMKIGIEKNFPGVHCDIGGAYPTGEENKLKIAEQSIVGNVFSSVVGTTKLEIMKGELIDEYWFNNNDKDNKQIWTSSTLTKITLASKRFLKKEYSYIPLQFMEEYCRQTPMDNYFIEESKTKFSIDDDTTLVDVKKHLKPYVMNEGGTQWQFISDKELEEKKKKREEEAAAKLEKEREQNKQEQMRREVDEQIKNPKSMQPVYDNLNPDYYRPNVVEIAPKKELDPAKEGDPNHPILLEEVVVTARSPQKLLRELRNKYLHWSADCKGIGLEGREDRKREEFPKA
jgi:Uncharacterized alpha/beta hydrolase domain (DUF2235)